MSILLDTCCCGRTKASNTNLCDICDALRVESIQRVHERERKGGQAGVLTYRPTEQSIIDSINANAARARRKAAPIVWEAVARLLVIGGILIVLWVVVCVACVAGAKALGWL